MTIWNPDTCDCILEYDKNIKYARNYKKCRLHKGFSAQPLLDTVIAQNRRFNLSFGNNPNERQQEVMTEAKRVNIDRIRKEDLTNFDEHLPHEAFFSALRSALRL